MKREIIGAQGEVTIFRLSGDMPDGVKDHGDKARGLPIISHSENGHHHLLDRPVEMKEAEAPPQGMRILYALLDQPTRLFQDAADAHGEHLLSPGLYEFRIAREFDPFAEQARMVAD